MSSNSSNASLASPSTPSFTSFYSILLTCYSSTVGTSGIAAFTVIVILTVLPPCVLILHLGIQKWRQQRCSNTAMSHSDVFTYHMVAIELFYFLGLVLILCAAAADLPLMLTVSIMLISTGFIAQVYFHTFTCVERYLAVVHPVTYRNLGKEKSVQIRNISTGCAWLLGIMGTAFQKFCDPNLINIVTLCLLILILIVISFCSLSVLYVLIRPGPGKGGGAKQRVDQSKLRAFYTITAILGALLFRFVGNILTSSLYDSPLLGESGRCVVLGMTFWVSLPTSLVVPLLFLHRAGKLQCCQRGASLVGGSRTT